MAVIASLAAAGFSYYSLAGQGPKIVGFATSTGTANLTVDLVANINFTDNVIMWGNGSVDTGMLYAILDTAQGTVGNGSWTPETSGLTLENIGNVNVTLDLKVGKSAADFIGGTDPAYEWNVSNSDVDSCVADAGFTLDVYSGTTTSDTNICDYLLYNDASDAVRIDIKLKVPYNSLKGYLVDTITATGTAV
ncbi:MAG: hypothetical protein MUF61_01465 [archaeon]|nr:hypothetical protein [archaeon]